MDNLKINYLAVLICVFWMFFLGFMWYGPIFGEPWMNMVGLDLATVEANPPGPGVWIANTFSSAFGIFLLAWLFVKMGVDNAMKGLLIGALIGIGFNLLPGMVNGFFAKNPYGLAWVTGGFQVVGWSVAGIVLGAWKKKA